MTSKTISGVGIIFDALGARNELRAELPETAESGASLNIVNRPNGLPYVLRSVFHHAGIFYAGSLEVQPLVTLARTVIDAVVVSLLVCIVKYDC